jgi:ribose transport system substrate-binding protein
MKLRSRLWLGSAVSALALGFTVAACGSEHDNTSSATSASSASSGGDLRQLAAAVHKAMEPVTAWPGPNDRATPAKGKKVVVVTCSAQGIGCVRAAAGATQAGKALGWTVQTVDGKGDPTIWNSAIESAVAGKAHGIILAAVPPPLVQGGIAKAKAAKIPIVEVFQDAPVAASVNFDHREQGVAMARWVITDSGGKASVLLVSDAEFKELTDRVDGFTAEIAKCGGCKLLGVVNSQIGTMAQRLPQAIVSALQRDPTTTYIISPFDSNATFTSEGVRQAGRAAQVKVAGYEGDPQAIEAVRKGQIEAATIASPAEWMGWQAIDELVRAFNEQPTHNTPIPTRLITKDNAPVGGKGWLGDFDYQTKFRELWGIGS